MSDYQSNAFRLKRGRTADLWSPLNFEALRSDPTFGFAKEFDFVDSVNDLSAWTFSSLGGATATNAVQQANFGQILLDPGATTANHGRQMQFTAACMTPAVGAIMAMEATIKWTTITTTPYFLFGFASLDTTALSAGAIDTADFIGIHCGGTDGHLDSRYRVTSGTAAGTDDLFTGMTTAVFVKVGVRVTDTNKAEFWINGIKKPAFTLTTTPTAILTPTIVHQGQGTVQPTLTIDLISVGYAYSPTVITE